LIRLWRDWAHARARFAALYQVHADDATRFSRPVRPSGATRIADPAANSATPATPAMSDHRTHVARAVDSALRAADPYDIVAAAAKRAWGDTPSLGGRACVLVGAGKASVAMARAVLEVGKLQPVPGGGVIVCPPMSPGHRAPPAFVGRSVRLMEADHPLPTQRNLVAAQAVLDAARTAGMRRVPLVAVLSGGASAHLTLPERGITLADIRGVTDALLKAGATVHELNTVRKHVEKLKGGRLALAASPSPVQAFILSDVPGDDPSVIASGPTSADASTFAEALAVLEHRGAADVAPAVTEHLIAGAAGHKPETPKPGDASLERSRGTIVGSSSLAVVAATDALKACGFVIAEARFEVQGEAREVGVRLAEVLLEARERRVNSAPIAVIWGGETTVRVAAAASHGFGGRNQELAISAALRLADVPGVVVASYATDGVDGVSPPGRPPVAGAIVTGRTLGDARAAGIDLAAALALNDSYRVCQSLGLHHGTGPTGTNVNDLTIGLVY